MAQGQCVGCLRPTKTFVSGKCAKWCSRTCRLRHREERRRVPSSCIDCGAHHLAYKRKGKISDRCPYCNTQKAARIHSEVCAIRRIARWKPKVPKVPKVQKNSRRTILWRQCDSCGVAFGYSKGQNRRFCSRTCVASCLRTVNKIPDSRSCVVCNVEFSPLPAFYQMKCCSEDCREIYRRCERSTSKRKRRMKRRGLGDLQRHYINAAHVFRRDAWKCKACGCDTPKELRGTYDDNAPELDHVVPVARGGADVPENLQCLCRLCNSLKGVMSMDEFISSWICIAA